MGLSIHYQRKLKIASELKAMIEEIQDVAKTHQWKTTVFEDQFKNDCFSEEVDCENLYGIMISPDKSEPLCFSFLSNGKMCGIINFNVLQIDDEIKEDVLYSLATKTQYACFETHIKLIEILDYISQKHLIDFECTDEGLYWETRDEELLKATFNKYEKLIESFASSIEEIPINENENIEDYIIRIADITKHRIDDED
jgi:hypothetical protein